MQAYYKVLNNKQLVGSKQAKGTTLGQVLLVPFNFSDFSELITNH